MAIVAFVIRGYTDMEITGPVFCILANAFKTVPLKIQREGLSNSICSDLFSRVEELWSPFLFQIQTQATSFSAQCSGERCVTSKESSEVKETSINVEPCRKILV